MGRIFGDKDLDKAEEEIKRASEDGARQAARKTINKCYGLDDVTDGKGKVEGQVILPNEARAHLRPNKHDPLDIDISAGTGDPNHETPLVLPETIEAPRNNDGSVTVDPRDVPDTLRKIGKVNIAAERPALKDRIGFPKLGRSDSPVTR